MTREVAISEVATVNPRAPRSLFDDSSRRVHFVPMANLHEDGQVISNGDRPIAEVSKGYTYFENGDVLVAKITPCMENGKAAFISHLPLKTAFGSTEFHVLRPSDHISGKYLFYMVWNQTFRAEASRNMTGSAGQKRVPAAFFDRFTIPLPPLVEQKRIAAILDKADTLRRKRRESVALSEALLHAGFMDIVSPGARDYRRWPAKTIEDMTASHTGAMRTGPFGSDLRHSEFVSEGIAVLGIDNAVQNRFAWGERRFITPEKYEGLKRYTVRAGDVIVTIMGTTGRSAVVPKNIPTAITTKHLATITPNRDVAEPEFISNAIHRHPVAQRQIAGSERGAIMAGLNLGLIKSIQLPTPPIETQRTYAQFVNAARSEQATLECAAAAADDLFHSLAQRALRGGL